MFSKLFIERPRLAVVLSIIITLAGLIAVFSLPVAEYPSITPPVIRVRAAYPGANAQVVRDTVAAPIEQEMNGVEDMLYMNSDCTNNGGYTLEVTFDVDSDPDIDQVNVQNRLQLAQSQLPQAVVDQGIDVRRRSSDMLGVIAFTSPDGSRSRLFMSNYISRTIKDALQRIDGVSDVYIFGETEYSMRIWLDPDRLTALGMSAEEVIQAIREQNVQATLGSVGTAPNVPGQKMQYTLTGHGRLEQTSAFEDIIIRSNDQGGLVRVKDVAEVELGSKDYSAFGKFDNQKAIMLALYRSSEANALDTVQQVRSELGTQAQNLPEGMTFTLPYDTTLYVQETIQEITFTLGLTFTLVVLVIFMFLQNIRATLIPATAVPVSIIGTFAVLLSLGFNLNTISLFALILAIGLVVDDAIVVVENVHRIMETEDLGAREATIKAMSQVTGPIVATTLVLLAIFVPVAFMPGITGLLYKQFGVTLCVSVLISSICALTLSPALCGVLLKKPKAHKRGPTAWFNSFMGFSQRSYPSFVGWLIRHLAVGIGLFLLLGAGAWFLSGHIPSSFLPQEDKGGFLIDIELPEGASLERTDAVTTKVTQKLLKMEGVEYVLAVNGFSLLSGQAENVGLVIADLDPWDERKRPDLSINALVGKTMGQLNSVTTATIRPFIPPPIQGLGTTGGFDFRLQATQGQSPQELASVAMGLAGAANQDPALSRVYTTFSADTPQIFVDLERTRMEELGVSAGQLFSTLSRQLGSQYVNDFNLFGRTYQVKARSQARYRKNQNDIKDLYVTSDRGHEVPVHNLINLSTTIGARVITRYNQFSSAAIKGEAAPGFSSGQAMAAMERLAGETLPEGYTFEWSTMSYQEQKASGTVGLLFALAVTFAYLFLVALYESWNLPLSIVLSVIVASLGGFAGLWATGHPLSIYSQIGMVLLVGLAAKNAILIVEFARDSRQAGASTYAAALEGAGTRFRPVLMTALTFILGVAPLVWATGAGAASRSHIGTVVFSGMIAATTLGILLIPVLYFLFQRLGEKTHERREKQNLQGKIHPVCMLLLPIILLCLSGCATLGPDYTPIQPEAPQNWEAGMDNGLQASRPARDQLAAWWEVFDDPVLTRLEDMAVDGNLDLKTALSRLRQARLQRGITRSGYFPTLSADGSVQKQRGSESIQSPSGGREQEVYSSQFDSAWELDLFGKVQRSVQAAQAELEANQAQVQDALISLMAEVAVTYTQVRTYQHRLEITTANIQSQAKTYELNTSRHTAGLIDELAVQQSLRNLERSRSQVATLQNGLRAAKNRLAVLLGRAPGALDQELSPVQPLPQVPTQVAVGIPAEAMRRRPDIRSAERNLAAQTARIGAATAELYPQFSLLGTIGLEALDASGDFLDPASRFWSIGPSLRWNIFQGKALRLNIELQTEKQKEAMLAYTSTVLLAQEEIEDALTAYAKEQNREESLRKAVKAAKRTEWLARDRYSAGLVNFYNVLDAQRELLDLEDELVQSQGQVVSNLARLYKALGGGWKALGTLDEDMPKAEATKVGGE